MNYFQRIFMTGLVSVLCACNGASTTGQTVPYLSPVVTPAPGAPALSFSANPNNVAAGGSATLTWSATNVSGCTASGGWTGSKALAGSQTVTVSSSTTYVLTCSTASGSGVVKNVNVGIYTAPSVSLTASPTSVAAGGSSSLTWSTTNATGCTASGAWSGTRAVTGTQSLTNLTATGTYTLACTGAGGTTTQGATVTVTSTAPPPSGGPSISSVTGTWDHRASITLSGANFGSKGTAAPTVWDDASGNSILDKWDGAWPDNNPAYNTVYRSPMRGIGLPHNHITRYIAGAHGQGAGADGGYNVIFFKYRSMASYPQYTYASWYERADDNWVFGGDNNYKTFAFSEGQGPYNMPNNWYLAFNTPLPDSNTSTGASYVLGDDSNFATLLWTDTNNHSHWWDAAINPMAGAWKKVELEAKYTNQNDGFIKLWENGVLRVNYAGPTDKYPGSTRTEGIGGYARMYNQANNWRYFADAYLDNSLAHVILGNASTYSASTVREVQIPSAWSSNTITVTANLGKFSAGQTAYIYVIDANGNVNANGYAVTVTGG